MVAVTICSIFGVPQNKVSDCFHHFPIYLPFAMKWWDQMPWSQFSECWVLSQLFHSPLLFSPRGNIVFLSSSSLSAIRVLSSVYLRLLIFLPAILIPACASSSLAFHMMYSAYKLNKQGYNVQPWHTPFYLEPVWCSMFSSNCCFLVYIQISQERGQVVWYFPISLRIFWSLLWST